MWSCRTGQATDDNIIWRMRIVCWTNKAINTHSDYEILIAFLQQNWLHERASMQSYTYFACLVQNKNRYFAFNTTYIVVDTWSVTGQTLGVKKVALTKLHSHIRQTQLENSACEVWSVDGTAIWILSAAFHCHSLQNVLCKRTSVYQECDFISVKRILWQLYLA